jgi:uncharacterized protein
MKPNLIIFAKAPRMGVSKTRLAAGIGVARAWRVKRTLDAFTFRTARSGGWTTTLAVAPDRDLATCFQGAWPNDLPRICQGRGTLGQRMARAMRVHSRGPVCIIGSDLPNLRTRDVADAVKALRRYDVVVGPATDGGYWLIGMSAGCARRAKLDGIRWSSTFTLADTISALPPAWRVGYLRELEDVDDAGSFKRASRSAKKLPNGLIRVFQSENPIAPPSNTRVPINDQCGST